MKSSIKIAQEAHLRPIAEIASSLGLDEDDLEFYGKYKAKISPHVWERIQNKPTGKMIVVTAMSPTPAGEGKTTTTIGLSQALARIGRNCIVCVREPSLGPLFGMKGGATGGGYSQIVPMEDINLHFTGDLHAISSANNLLSSLLDNHLYFGNGLNIDHERIVWRRAIDMNDRSLRKIKIGIGGPKGGTSRDEGFEITAASEVTAIISLSKNLNDLKERLSRIIVAYTKEGKPVFARDIKASGAMALLLKDALKPNLVQTLENTPAIVHGGPFANIAHGSPSIIGIRLCLKISDYVVVEPGFGADLGVEKFFNIVCRQGEFTPDAVVLVVSLRALKMHGGVEKDRLGEKNAEALESGFDNVSKHVENLVKFGVPTVIAINKFENDRDEELDYIKTKCENLAPTAISNIFLKGGDGGIELAEKLIQVMSESKASFHFLYDLDLSVEEKVSVVAKEVYGADGINFTSQAEESIRRIREIGLDGLPICVAKTQYSFSDDPNLLGRPRGFKITVTDVKPSAGAGFLVIYAGNILTMPGLPKNPSAENMDLDQRGRISGLF